MKPLEWSTEKRMVNELLPYDKNPRKITEEKKTKLMRSLDKFNLAEIPCINTDGVIIGGNQRVKLLQMAGRGEEMIDVRVPNRKLSDAEVKEYAIISNTHAGEFDLEILDEFFGDIDFEEIGVEIPDYKLPDPVVPMEAQEDDYEIPDEIVTDIVVGDFFQIGRHRLLCGDSTNTTNIDILLGGGICRHYNYRSTLWSGLHRQNKKVAQNKKRCHERKRHSRSVSRIIGSRLAIFKRRIQPICNGPGGTVAYRLCTNNEGF
jgi:hypothetical protein